MIINMLKEIKQDKNKLQNGFQHKQTCELNQEFNTG